MNTNTLFIRLGGIMNILAGTLHIKFWSMFDWSTELDKLSVVNSNIMQMLNLFTIVFFFFSAAMLMLQTRHILESIIGRYFLAMLATMYLARLVMEFYFPQGSLTFAGILLATTVFFAIPVFERKSLSHAN